MTVLTHTSDLMAAAERLSIMCNLTPTILVERAAGCEIWAKLEHQHPSGSTKDRVAAQIVADGIKRGHITPDTVVVEASSGSMSISLAMACSLAGIRFIAVMPANVTPERCVMIRGLGGEVVLTDPDSGMAAALAEVERLAAESDDVFLPHQFENRLNTDVHASTTGEELLAQVPGTIAAFVAGVGTGGTLTGVARALRSETTDVVIAEAHPVGRGGGISTAVPGVVDGYSKLLATQPADRHISVLADDALTAARDLIARGFPVRPSSGLNLAAARQLAGEVGEDRIATIFPDRMERYFSSALFTDLGGR